jgi:BlaI family penicillinase repressor
MTGKQKSPPGIAAKTFKLTLAPAEWEIMKVLWDHGAMAARDVYAALPSDHGWAYKTVKTLLSRLVAKGAIAYDQIGNSYLYRAAVARDQMTRQEVRSVFQRIMSEAFSPVLAHFIDEAELSDDEIKELKRKLDEKRQKKSGGKRRRGPHA